MNFSKILVITGAKSVPKEKGCGPQILRTDTMGAVKEGRKAYQSTPASRHVFQRFWDKKKGIFGNFFELTKILEFK